MLIRLDLWYRFLEAGFWWMHAMVLVWALLTFMLFVAEPLFLHRWLIARPIGAGGHLRLVEWLHWLLLMLSPVTVFGAVAGSSGL